MERELPPYRQTFKQAPRASSWPAILIGAFMLAIIAGGVHLLGETRQRWESNKAAQASKSAEFERQWKAQQFPPTTPAPDRTYELARLRQLREDAEQRRLEQQGLRKCINGVVFRRIPNGWENVPHARC